MATQAQRRTAAAEDGDGTAPVGDQIRELRRAKGLTIAELAERIGRSVGYVSQVERNMSTLSIPALKAISDALGVQITWFFQGNATAPAEERDIVVRAGARRTLRYPGTGVVEELLSPNLGRAIELLISTFEPGASSGEAPYARTGEEAGLVLSGRLELHVGARRFMLETGDSFAFESTEPHWCRNPGRETTVVAWVITPPAY
ncbi:MAG: helix-turn-helix transcriptional regulator [Hyphomicrobiales bacterium]|nr:helix-turn-helix transcriptional regulator [Hyphomicrobiales bacterium]MCP5373882.1 helix-turn-helix transcriptional regulator [Hyphomicrobiales bacterium]